MHCVAPTEKGTGYQTLEKRLWAAADQFQANSGFRQTVIQEQTVIFMR